MAIKSEILKINGHEIEIRRRPRQKSLRLRVLPTQKIRISCALRTPKSDLYRFLAESRQFIERELERLNQTPQPMFESGDRFTFLGRERELSIIDGEGRPQLTLAITKFNLSGKPTSKEERKMLFRKFFKKTGQKYLTQRVQFFSEAMNLNPSGLSFRSQNSRWGSCSSTGHISLNYRLMAAPPEIIDYVVVHELAHLKHYNHSPLFWDLVRQYSPNYHVHKKWLRQNSHMFHFFER